MNSSLGKSPAANPSIALPAWILWFIFLTVICVLVGRRPNERTVTPNYRNASIAWWNGKDIYTEQVGGYLYLPQAAILYTPFTLPPLAVGEVCWRLFGGLLLVMAVYRTGQSGRRRGLAGFLPDHHAPVDGGQRRWPSRRADEHSLGRPDDPWRDRPDRKTLEPVSRAAGGGPGVQASGHGPDPSGGRPLLPANVLALGGGRAGHAHVALPASAATDASQP